ncbi:unnamed protein product [Periconia digitata]|uniref:Uncharacterized protein n=1 Tax=Periconia digitata TaxID=1303443 RepID=A0A9W4XV91_9PLEO|nr:unnamed protein product [Periconia digitata]
MAMWSSLVLLLHELARKGSRTSNFTIYTDQPCIFPIPLWWRGEVYLKYIAYDLFVSYGIAGGHKDNHLMGKGFGCGNSFKNHLGQYESMFPSLCCESTAIVS